jgi:hypothetical protein
MGGDGPNKIGLERAEEGSSDEVRAEEEEGEGRVEAAGHGGHQPHGGYEGGSAPKPSATASSKGINPVQHSE